MKSMKLTLLAGALVLAACGGDNNDSNNGTNNNTAANNTAGNNTAGNNTAGNNGSSGGGDFFQATGSYNGSDFTVECDLDDPVKSSLTSGEYEGHEQCPGTQVQIQCRHPEMGFGGVSGQFFVQVQVYDTEDNYTISMGDTLGAALNTGNSANIGANSVTLDTFVVDQTITGSFTAEWTDDGSGAYGTVSGTFDATCDE